MNKKREPSTKKKYKKRNTNDYTLQILRIGHKQSTPYIRFLWIQQFQQQQQQKAARVWEIKGKKNNSEMKQSNTYVYIIRATNASYWTRKRYPLHALSFIIILLTLQYVENYYCTNIISVSICELLLLCINVCGLMWMQNVYDPLTWYR